MSASGMPAIRKNKLHVTTIFTTHATILGRHIAMNDPALITCHFLIGAKRLGISILKQRLVLNGQQRMDVTYFMPF